MDKKTVSLGTPRSETREFPELRFERTKNGAIDQRVIESLEKLEVLAQTEFKAVPILGQPNVEPVRYVYWHGVRTSSCHRFAVTTTERCLVIRWQGIPKNNVPQCILKLIPLAAVAKGLR